ncbi:hypothetical protein P3342_011345 [Pyrenophora teres f. teres]|uniref:Mitochondrial F1F0 ATP synthase subunit Atp18 n=1 Tax=Pyrenophora teres f. teres (strain 0-1) TaxID=861557 RepID=E3RSP6_PYRTT|nr:hypothetical protein PTT_11955 [Pyrenophora teres f. teres 0-1]KAK1909266.1 hypothetical protein P3342_011345 [Pyrenophora teres f. teres]
MRKPKNSFFYTPLPPSLIAIAIQSIAPPTHVKMPLLGRKFPAQIAKPMWPFYVSGLVILYGVNSAANAMAQGEEYKNDPRNPAVKNQAPNH